MKNRETPQPRCKFHVVLSLSTWALVFLLSCGMTGSASWYSTEACQYNSDPKCPMANGRSLYEAESAGELFGASWSYPLGTIIKVTNLQNGRHIRVRITDRGPSKRLGRVLDLGKEAFARLENPKKGIIQVRIERI